MDCSTPGFFVLHHLLELAQTHVHWVADAIRPFSSFVAPFSCLQAFLASGSFPMSQVFTWGGQSIGVSALVSVLPVYTQDWSPLGWTGWISLQSKGLTSLLQHHSSEASVLWCSASFTVQLSHPYVTTGKTIALTRLTFVGKIFLLLKAGDPASTPKLGRSAGEGIGYPLQYSWASLEAQLVKNPPAMWETWVRSLDWESPLEKGKATHSTILAWRIPWTLQSMGLQRVGHYRETFTSLHFLVDSVN